MKKTIKKTIYCGSCKYKMNFELTDVKTIYKLEFSCGSCGKILGFI
jgi:hypothetical protein